MNGQVETRRDETLAIGLYTGIAGATPRYPQIRFAHFEYTIQRKKSLFDEVVVRFGESLKQELPPEHLALLERGEEQSPEDIALAERMRDVQREALMH
jgi:hypothetical protein